jgi:hypothetical protein
MCLIKCHCYQFNLISDPRADNQTCGRTAVMLATTAVMLATTAVMLATTISKSAIFS